MPSRQRDKLIAATGEEYIIVDEQRSGPLPCKSGEHRLKIIFSDRPHDENLHADRTARLLHGCRVMLGVGVVGVDQQRNGFGCRYQLMQKPQLLRLQWTGNLIDAGQVAAPAAEAGDQAGLNRVDAAVEDNGNRGGHGLRRQRRRPIAGENHETFRRTKSAASAGSRSYWPSAQRYSIATFWPST